MRGQHTRWAVAGATLWMVGAGKAPTAAQPETVHAFADVTVIPMDSARVLEHQTVVVTNDRVTRMGPAHAVRIPPGATIVDGRGRYLVPGLGDAHAHLSTQGGDTARAARALTLFVLNGVTMVRSMYTEPHHATAKARVDRGELPGPRVVLVSPPLHGGSARTPDAARDSVRKYAAEGYAQVKILPGVSALVFEALAAEARGLGLQLVGHVPTSIGLPAALASFASLEHLDGYIEAMQPAGVGVEASGFFGFGLLETLDDARMPLLVTATRESGVTVVPTLVSMEAYANADGASSWMRSASMRYVPGTLSARWAREKEGFARGNGVTSAKATRFLEVRRRLLRELHAGGVPVALGSDGFSLFTVPGFSTLDELEAFVAAGLTPFAALEAATVRVARLLRLDGVTGTVAVGAAADLILLDGNPLDRIENVRRQAGVMHRGRWTPRDAIARQLSALLAP